MLMNMHHVTKSYRRRGQDVDVLKEVEFGINCGESVCMMGPSGSGKSTLLRIAAGLQAPSKGEIRYDGISLSTYSDTDLTMLRRQKIGYVPQEPSLLPELTVQENIMLPWYFEPAPENIAMRLLWLLDCFNLSDLSARYPADLSGGEKRRVAVARALIIAPDLLLADEPTNDQDEKSVTNMLQLFRRLTSEGMAMLIVTHEQTARQYCKTCYNLQEGALHSVKNE